jgi:hypothetical protein
VDPAELKPHPRNRNAHPKDQIDRLAQILEYQGWRYPVNVSKRSGFIVTGHGRVQAAQKLGCSVPVVYQDFESDEQEYASVQSDNAIASWAELDLAKINLDLAELGPDFDIDLLGIENFVLDPSDKWNSDDEWKDMPEYSHEDKTAYRRLIVNFASDAAVLEFAKRIGQDITEKALSIWFPPAKIEKYSDKVYEQPNVNES